MYPDVFSSAPPDTEGGVKKTNEKFGGWDLEVDRLFLANGIRAYHVRFVQTGLFDILDQIR